MQNLGVTAEAKSVLNLLQPGVQYRIPSYQRSYSWQVSDATALIDDLIVGLDEDRPHFLGAIVTVKTSVPGLFEVVDGQQRVCGRRSGLPHTHRFPALRPWPSS